MERESTREYLAGSGLGSLKQNMCDLTRAEEAQPAEGRLALNELAAIPGDSPRQSGGWILKH